MYRIIYIFKISKTGPLFPNTVTPSRLILETSESSPGSYKYLPRENLGLCFDASDGHTPTAPIPHGTLEGVLDWFFSTMSGTAYVETIDPLPSPFLLRPSATRKVPDYMATLRSDPSIELSPSKCESPLTPWRYRLPGSEEWIEVDSLGVRGMGFFEELQNYFTKSKGAEIKK